MSYLGSKAASGVFQKIIAEMPPHDTYIETHLGSGAVMFHKPPAQHSVGIDIDSAAFSLTRRRWKDKGLTPLTSISIMAMLSAFWRGILILRLRAGC